MPVEILIVFDSRGGLIEQMAYAAGEGVDSVPNATAKVARIEDADVADLERSHGIILGSPNWSGLTGKMKSWMDSMGDLWLDGQIKDKPGGAFTAGSTRTSGIEATLLMLIHWMLAGGMVIVGLPFTERMRLSGSYYGATASGSVTMDDLEQTRVLGKRVAQCALALKSNLNCRK